MRKMQLEITPAASGLRNKKRRSYLISSSWNKLLCSLKKLSTTMSISLYFSKKLDFYRVHTNASSHSFVVIESHLHFALIWFVEVNAEEVGGDEHIAQPGESLQRADEAQSWQDDVDGQRPRHFCTKFARFESNSRRTGRGSVHRQRLFGINTAGVVCNLLIIRRHVNNVARYF